MLPTWHWYVNAESPKVWQYEIPFSCQKKKKVFESGLATNLKNFEKEKDVGYIWID